MYPFNDQVGWRRWGFRLGGKPERKVLTGGIGTLKMVI